MEFELIGRELNLGEFNVECGSVKIGDPCYSPETWCLGSKENVLNGKWQAKILEADDSETGWGDRNTVLFAFNKAYFKDNYNHDDIDIEWFVKGGYRNSYCLDYDSATLGVDSGQAGIYDERHYINMHLEDEGKDLEDTWYDSNGNVTLYGDMAGVLPDKKGCVSRAGYGDGVYDYLCFFNSKGETVAILIVFIAEYEEDQYDEDDDY